MKALRLGLITAALSMLALPAHAAVIGLLGGDFDPAPISDPSIFPFGACNNEVGNSIGNEHFDDFRCIFYDFPDIDGVPGLDSVFSIEFFIYGLDPEEQFTVDPFSDLPTLGGDTLVPGSLRLSGGTITPTGGAPCIECFMLLSFNEPITGLVLFVGPDEGGSLPSGLSGQVVAVNEFVPVPEPATLLLLGPGVIGTVLARRRLARRE